MNKPSKVPEVYALKSYYADDFDMIRKLVEIFSFHWKTEGRVVNVLRNKLVILLSIYIKDGYSKETKEKARKILDTNVATINSLNLELRQGNYLKKDVVNSTTNHLHEDLELMRDYIHRIPSAIEAGTPFVLFQIKRADE